MYVAALRNDDEQADVIKSGGRSTADIIAENELRRIEDEARAAQESAAPKREYKPRMDDPLKFPYYALGSELVPFPQEPHHNRKAKR